MGSPVEPASGPAGVGSLAIREQLDRVLASPQFRNSKRCQALLRFVTERLLHGEPDDLREKIIGIKVFARDATYDTGHDAIVRNVATEVRKRLAQYYLEAAHERELRIELPAGSYVPAFTPARDHPTEPPPMPAPAPRAAKRFDIPRWLAACAVVLALGVAALAWRLSASDFDRFWAPVFRANESVQVCIGQPGRLYRFMGPRQTELDGWFMGPDAKPETARQALAKTPIAPEEIRWIANRYLYMRDAFAMARLAALVQSKGSAFRLSPDTETSYSELRRSPVIAIGGFNNHWVLRFGNELRFVFDHKTIDGLDYNCITDRRNPSATQWKISRTPGAPLPEDYAIVTRVVDPSTERTVVMVAGIDDSGTLAAGEFITEPAYMNAALRSAPSGWNRHNIQIVLHTKTVEGSPGPASVVATHFW